MRILVLFCIFLLNCNYTEGSISPSVDKYVTKLDSYLNQKTNYDKHKEQIIDELRANLHGAHTDQQRYEISINLYNEYKSYKYDSAFVYANRSLSLAKKIENKNYEVEASSDIVFCLLSAGLYKEAFDVVSKIDVTGVDKKYKITYYSMCIRLNYDMADYNHAAPYQKSYIHRGDVYSDSLLSLLPVKSSQWWYITGQRQMKGYKYRESLRSFMSLLRYKDIDIHTRAIATSCIGWIYWRLGDEDKAMQYLSESAVSDLISSTKETTALRSLAELLYKRGDMKRAIEYVQFSFDDANFYNARQRKIEVGEIMPIIEQNRYNIVSSQRNLLIVGIVLAILLIVVMAIAITLIYKQKKKLQNARNVIDERNNQLLLTNNQLTEANKIKDEYIGNSFYTNAEFIEKEEKLYKMIERKIITRQFDDLRNSVRESSLNKERDNMYVAFDATFLKLFPGFVSGYNALFPEAERKAIDNDHSLTTEMRIFALIRLGITESERIAKFLNYSVNTINTYKTRIKNKSLIDNDSFEQKIMEIGVVNI